MLSCIPIWWLGETDVTVKVIPEGSVEGQASRGDARYLW